MGGNGMQIAVGSKQSTSQASAQRSRIAVADPERFGTDRIQAIRHDFHRHPLLQLDALADLARSLSLTGQCRFIAPDTAPDAPFEHRDADHAGRAIDEVFARIEQPGSWIALYNVETHPAYRELLEEITSTVRPLVERREPGMFDVGGFIFVSAPPSVTPFHIDRENNFWLQIRGRKVMHVWEPTDSQVVSEIDREAFIVNADLEKVRLKPGHEARSHRFDVGPGDGVYFPSTSPHMTRSERDWVVPGDAVSISIGVVFYTSQTRRLARLHVLNRTLRRLGLQPSPPGARPLLDSLKYPLACALVGFKKRFRGYARAGI